MAGDGVVDGRAPVAMATLRYFRCSPQKARLVVDQIRGRNVNEALVVLRHSPKAASRAIEKLVRSAVANAAQAPEKVDVDTLMVGEAQVGPGPSFKRFRGRAFGRAFQILHRTCHVTVKLTGPRRAEPAVAAAPAAGARVAETHQAKPVRRAKAKAAARGTAGRVAKKGGKAAASAKAKKKKK